MGDMLSRCHECNNERDNAMLDGGIMYKTWKILLVRTLCDKCDARQDNEGRKWMVKKWRNRA